MSQGILCLDIDGTLTDGIHRLDPKVVASLTRFHNSGWKIAFITGRTFSWGYRTLSSLPFPYHLAVMNGAIILSMPDRKILKKKYLNQDILPTLEKICEKEPTDFAVYGGFEHNDICYYRSKKFSPELNAYLARRRETLQEVWEDVPSFENLHLSEFPSVKCFGDWNSTSRIVEKIEEILGLHVPLIKDPFDSRSYVAQATHPLVNKGYAMSDLKELLGLSGPTIAAGDDNNDKSMLAQADIKIVMSNAPQEVLSMADIIAPPASQLGIIQGLEDALVLAKKKKLLVSKQQRPLVTVGAVVRASDGSILWVKSWKWGRKWSLPGGKVELGESCKAAVVREVLEETGLEVVNPELFQVQESIFSEEFWTPSHFVMHDHVMDLAPGYSKNDVVLNDEAEEYCWATPEEAANMDLIQEGIKVLEGLKYVRNNRS